MKGQAAMEFLMTYGWALLIVLVAIGVLATFGVFSGSKRALEACLMGPGLSCKDFRIVKTIDPAVNGVIYMMVTNGFGKDFEHFFVTINPRGNTCQGMTGYIAFSLPPPINSFEYFPDGSTKPVKNLQSMGDGLRCNNGVPPTGLYQQCCGYVNSAIIFAGVTGVAVPCQVPPGTTSCNPILLPSPGTRFKENIYITYKLGDSSLVHSRQGSIVGLVEAE